MSYYVVQAGILTNILININLENSTSLFYFVVEVALCTLVCLGIPFVDEAGLELTEITCLCLSSARIKGVAPPPPTPHFYFKCIYFEAGEMA